MKNMKLVIAFCVVAVLGAGAAGGAVWYLNKPAKADKPAEAADAAKKHDGKPHKYVTLDKVIIMLRRSPGDGVSHYLAADLVIATSEDKEKHVKEQLPMLRSVAVKALSGYTLAKAETMTVEQVGSEINRAFDASYTHEGQEKPFSDVMIGKLIIE